MKRYENYIEVDSRWARYIPASWIFSKIAGVFIERKENNDPVKTTDILSLTNTRGVIPYKEKGNIGNKAKEDLTGYRLAYPGDIVFNSMNAVIGSVGLSKYFGAVTLTTYEWTYTFNTPGMRRAIQFKPVYREMGKEDIVGSITPVQYLDVTAYLNVDGSTTLNAYKGGGDGTPFNVSSNMPWTATSDVSWIQLTADVANGKLAHHYEQNRESNARTGHITVSATGCADVVITVTQDAYDAAVIYSVDLSPKSGKAGERFTLTATTNAATAWLYAVNNTGTPLRDGAFKYTGNTADSKKIWTATYTADVANSDRYWKVTPFNEVDVAGGYMSSNYIGIEPSPTPTPTATPTPTPTATATLSPTPVAGEYSMWYRFDSNANQKAPDTLTFDKIGIKGKTITLWGVSSDSTKGWAQPNLKDSGKHMYQFWVTDDNDILDLGAHDFSGEFTGNVGTAYVNIYDIANAKVICGVTIVVADSNKSYSIYAIAKEGDGTRKEALLQGLE